MGKGSEQPLHKRLYPNSQWTSENVLLYSSEKCKFKTTLETIPIRMGGVKNEGKILDVEGDRTHIAGGNINW